MDSTDRRLLEILQRDFPLVPEPFESLGQQLRISPQESLARIQALKQEGIIREISGIFDSRAMGYQAALVALSTPPEGQDGAASIVSQHPGVSHNYAREHEYNLWFTLTIPPGEDLARASQELAAKAGARAWLFLPAVRVFKLGVFFRLSQGVAVEAGHNGYEGAAKANLSAQEIALVRALQQDAPLVERPFQSLAKSLKMGEPEFIQGARDLLNRGIMRRFGALLVHRRLGFAANGMGCWKVPPSRVVEVGKALARSPNVTHCYERLTYPQWPYNIFTMLHAPTREECEAMARSLATEVDVSDYLLLYSTREYKKERVRYFW